MGCSGHNASEIFERPAGRALQQDTPQTLAAIRIMTAVIFMLSRTF